MSATCRMCMPRVKEQYLQHYKSDHQKGAANFLSCNVHLCKLASPIGLTRFEVYHPPDRTSATKAGTL